MVEIELTRSIFKSNIEASITIYEDCESIISERTNQIESKIVQDSLSKGDFEEFSFYKYHYGWSILHALFISSYSYFEIALKKIATKIERNTDSRVKLKDLSGNSEIDRFRKFIYIIGEVRCANSDIRQWRDINEFRDIRNIIIHNYGETNKQIRKAEEHDIYFGPNKKAIRIKNKEFLIDFVRLSCRYIDDIADELSSKI